MIIIQSKIKRIIKNELQALLMAVLAALGLILGMTARPALYPADYGRYEVYLRECGLEFTQKDIEIGGLIYERGVKEFSYSHFSYARLFTPDVSNPNAYVVAVVRFFTAPFTDTYNVDSGMVIWAVLLVLSVFLITSALCKTGKRSALIPGIFLSMIFTDGNFTAMFKGLYPEGGAIALSLLTVGCYMCICALIKTGEGLAGIKAWALYALMLVSFLILIRTMPPLLIMLPASAAAFIYLFIKLAAKRKKSLIAGLFAVILLVTGIRGAVSAAAADADYTGYSIAYESIFNTGLKEADENEQIEFLSKIGLDPSYVGDIGKSFYQDEADYVHCPRDEETNADLQKAVTTRNAIRLYLTHPSILFKVVSRFGLGGNGYVNAENRADNNNKDITMYWTSDGIMGIARMLIRPSYTFYLVVSLSVLAILLVLSFKRRSPVYAISAAAVFSALFYVPVTVILNGFSMESETELYLTFLTDMNVNALAAMFYELSVVFEKWAKPQIAENTEGDIEAEEITDKISDKNAEKENGQEIAAAIADETAAKGAKGKGFTFETVMSRRGILVITAVLSIILMAMVLFRTPHAGSVNNGDFGRMMKQLGVIWTGNIYYDTDAQMSHKVIEEFVYQTPFDFRKLTPLDPTYSLYYFVSLLRLIDIPFTPDLNTFHLMILMSVIMLICIVVITSDLQRVIGKWSLLIGTGLGIVMFSETYMVWFNSLFGEGTIILGFMLTLMCAVHLAAMKKRGGVKSVVWLVMLALSMYILLTSKAQMLMCLPAAVLLFLILASAHSPYRYDFKVLYAALLLVLAAVMCAGALAVYRTDRTQTSVSEKHTLWQAYFYGIFMISDDPIKDMNDLGIDTRMAPDIGKYVDFSNDDNYVFAPLSDEAQTAFYDHVSTGTILKWYITHPSKLWLMLDHAASEANTLYTDFRVYTGQDYSGQHDKVDGMGLWLYWRPYFMPGSFAGYVAIYIVFLWYILSKLKQIRIFNRRNKNTVGSKDRLDSKSPGVHAQSMAMLTSIIFFILFAGAVQFPLSVLGNGFADNHKQLFVFSLCMDFLFIAGATIILDWVSRHSFSDLRKLKIKAK